MDVTNGDNPSASRRLLSTGTRAERSEEVLSDGRILYHPESREDCEEAYKAITGDDISTDCFGWAAGLTSESDRREYAEELGHPWQVAIKSDAEAQFSPPFEFRDDTMRSAFVFGHSVEVEGGVLLLEEDRSGAVQVTATGRLLVTPDARGPDGPWITEAYGCDEDSPCLSPDGLSCERYASVGTSCRTGYTDLDALCSKDDPCLKASRTGKHECLPVQQSTGECAEDYVQIKSTVDGEWVDDIAYATMATAETMASGATGPADDDGPRMSNTEDRLWWLCYNKVGISADDTCRIIPVTDANEAVSANDMGGKTVHLMFYVFASRGDDANRLVIDGCGKNGETLVDALAINKYNFHTGEFEELFNAEDHGRKCRAAYGYLDTEASLPRASEYALTVTFKESIPRVSEFVTFDFEEEMSGAALPSEDAVRSPVKDGLVDVSRKRITVQGQKMEIETEAIEVVATREGMRIPSSDEEKEVAIPMKDSGQDKFSIRVAPGTTVDVRATRHSIFYTHVLQRTRTGRRLLSESQEVERRHETFSNGSTVYYREEESACRDAYKAATGNDAGGDCFEDVAALQSWETKASYASELGVAWTVTVNGSWDKSTDSTFGSSDSTFGNTYGSSESDYESVSVGGGDLYGSSGRTEPTFGYTDESYQSAVVFGTRITVEGGVLMLRERANGDVEVVATGWMQVDPDARNTGELTFDATAGQLFAEQVALDADAVAMDAHGSSEFSFTCGDHTVGGFAFPSNDYDVCLVSVEGPASFTLSRGGVTVQASAPTIEDTAAITDPNSKARLLTAVYEEVKDNAVWAGVTDGGAPIYAIRKSEQWTLEFHAARPLAADAGPRVTVRFYKQEGSHLWRLDGGTSGWASQITWRVPVTSPYGDGMLRPAASGTVHGGDDNIQLRAAVLDKIVTFSRQPALSADISLTQEDDFGFTIRPTVNAEGLEEGEDLVVRAVYARIFYADSSGNEHTICAATGWNPDGSKDHGKLLDQVRTKGMENSFLDPFKADSNSADEVSLQKDSEGSLSHLCKDQPLPAGVDAVQVDTRIFVAYKKENSDRRDVEVTALVEPTGLDTCPTDRSSEVCILEACTGDRFVGDEDDSCSLNTLRSTALADGLSRSVTIKWDAVEMETIQSERAAVADLFTVHASFSGSSPALGPMEMWDPRELITIPSADKIKEIHGSIETWKNKPLGFYMYTSPDTALLFNDANELYSMVPKTDTREKWATAISLFANRGEFGFDSLPDIGIGPPNSDDAEVCLWAAFVPRGHPGGRAVKYFLDNAKDSLVPTDVAYEAFTLAQIGCMEATWPEKTEADGVISVEHDGTQMTQHSPATNFTEDWPTSDMPGVEKDLDPDTLAATFTFHLVNRAQHHSQEVAREVQVSVEYYLTVRDKDTGDVIPDAYVAINGRDSVTVPKGGSKALDVRIKVDQESATFYNGRCGRNLAVTGGISIVPHSGLVGKHAEAEEFVANANSLCDEVDVLALDTLGSPYSETLFEEDPGEAYKEYGFDVVESVSLHEHEKWNVIELGGSDLVVDGRTLTVPAGSRVKLRGTLQVKPGGRIVAEGGPEKDQKISFEKHPGTSGVAAVELSGGSADPNVLKHVVFHGVPLGLVHERSSSTIEDVEINFEEEALAVEGGDVDLSNVWIQDCSQQCVAVVGAHSGTIDSLSVLATTLGDTNGPSGTVVVAGSKASTTFTNLYLLQRASSGGYERVDLANTEFNVLALDAGAQVSINGASMTADSTQFTNPESGWAPQNPGVTTRLVLYSPSTDNFEVPEKTARVAKWYAEHELESTLADITDSVGSVRKESLWGTCVTDGSVDAVGLKLPLLLKTSFNDSVMHDAVKIVSVSYDDDHSDYSECGSIEGESVDQCACMDEADVFGGSCEQRQHGSKTCLISTSCSGFNGARGETRTVHTGMNAWSPEGIQVGEVTCAEDSDAGSAVASGTKIYEDFYRCIPTEGGAETIVRVGRTCSGATAASSRKNKYTFTKSGSANTETWRDDDFVCRKNTEQEEETVPLGQFDFELACGDTVEIACGGGSFEDDLFAKYVIEHAEGSEIEEDAQCTTTRALDAETADAESFAVLMGDKDRALRLWTTTVPSASKSVELVDDEFEREDPPEVLAERLLAQRDSQGRRVEVAEFFVRAPKGAITAFFGEGYDPWEIGGTRDSSGAGDATVSVGQCGLVPNVYTDPDTGHSYDLERGLLPSRAVDVLKGLEEDALQFLDRRVETDVFGVDKQGGKVYASPFTDEYNVGASIDWMGLQEYLNEVEVVGEERDTSKHGPAAWLCPRWDNTSSEEPPCACKKLAGGQCGQNDTRVVLVRFAVPTIEEGVESGFLKWREGDKGIEVNGTHDCRTANGDPAVVYEDADGSRRTWKMTAKLEFVRFTEREDSGSVKVAVSPLKLVAMRSEGQDAVSLSASGEPVGFWWSEDTDKGAALRTKSELEGGALEDFGEAEVVGENDGGSVLYLFPLASQAEAGFDDLTLVLDSVTVCFLNDALLASDDAARSVLSILTGGSKALDSPLGQYFERTGCNPDDWKRLISLAADDETLEALVKSWCDSADLSDCNPVDESLHVLEDGNLIGERTVTLNSGKTLRNFQAETCANAHAGVSPSQIDSLSASELSRLRDKCSYQHGKSDRRSQDYIRLAPIDGSVPMLVDVTANLYDPVAPAGRRLQGLVRGSSRLLLQSDDGSSKESSHSTGVPTEGTKKSTRDSDYSVHVTVTEQQRSSSGMSGGLIAAIASVGGVALIGIIGAVVFTMRNSSNTSAQGFRRVPTANVRRNPIHRSVSYRGPRTSNGGGSVIM